MGRRFVSAVVGLLASAPISVLAHDVEGLYRPVGSSMSWSCDIHSVGEDGGAFAFIDDTIYAPGTVCKIYWAATEGNWTRVRARCSVRGTEHFNEFRLRATSGGLEFDLDGTRFTWESCSDRAVPIDERTAEPRNGPWGSSFNMGWTEMGTGDDMGNSITIACNSGGTPENELGAIYVNIAGRPIPPGPVTFVIDGSKVSYEADDDGSINISDCRFCANEFNAFLAMLANGRLLEITPAAGGTVTFSLQGAGKVIGPDPACPWF